MAFRFSQHHLLKRLFFLYCIFWLLCQNLFVHIDRGLFLGFQFHSIGLCVCFSANSILFWLLSLCSIIWNEAKWYFQPCFFSLRIALAIQGLLCLHTHLIIFCSISLKNTISILIEITLNLYIALGNKMILTMLVPPTHKHGMSFNVYNSDLSYIHLILVKNFKLIVYSFQDLSLYNITPLTNIWKGWKSIKIKWILRRDYFIL